MDNIFLDLQAQQAKSSYRTAIIKNDDAIQAIIKATLIWSAI